VPAFSFKVSRAEDSRREPTQFIAECAVASPRVCSRLTAVPIQDHLSFWYVKDLMERR
jgi:hypothetical protein